MDLNALQPIVATARSNSSKRKPTPAAVLSKFGSAPAHIDIDTPEPAQSEVCVRVSAAAAGVRVIATFHAAAGKAHVSILGAAETVDYREDVAASVLAHHPEGVDAVVHLDGDLLARLTDNQGAGTTSVGIQRTYRLEDVPAALADFSAGTLGKLVITLNECHLEGGHAAASIREA